MADWSRAEVEAIVADYLDMLELELRGVSYSKTDHRRRLQGLLNDRSDGAIERKHQNVSAILLALGFPCIDGYKPLHNYQKLLYDVVAERRGRAPSLEEAVKQEVDRLAATPPSEQLPDDIESPPDSSLQDDRVAESYSDRPRAAARFTDYLAREARNASLGSAGEELVLRFEAARLLRAGAPHLADRVEHVSVTQGDGLGFDVLSYEPNGKERLIEVKTTAFGRHTPFFLTRNELLCSRERDAFYHLYRVFSFHRQPRIFALAGRLDDSCQMTPTQWMARATGPATRM